MQTIDIIKKIEHGLNALNSERAFVVAIDGMSGSGKTTLGNLLQEHFPESNLFHMDDFFLQPHQRTPERLAEIGGNVDYERFKEEIILQSENKNGFSYQVYDCHTQWLNAPIYMPWKPLVIIEGAYSHHPYFGDIYDLRIFCEISADEQRNRILKRNGADMLKRFEKEWIPKENQYFKHYKIKEKSGLQ